jgi:DNA repair protein RadC
MRVTEVLRPASARNCPSSGVAHNHPSGDPTPSAEDARVTKRLFHAARLLDIALLDHIVIGHSRSISLRQTGQGFG